MGSLAASGALTLDSGTEWIIDDVGTVEIEPGSSFILACAGVVTNQVVAADVHYAGINGPAGQYITITNVVVLDGAVHAVFGARDIMEPIRTARMMSRNVIFTVRIPPIQTAMTTVFPTAMKSMVISRIR